MPVNEFSAGNVDDAGDLNPCSYVIYYALLFFAYWFGSARFDMDGDGDFDPEDVQKFLEEKGFVSQNFKKHKKRPSIQGALVPVAKAKAAPKPEEKTEGTEAKEGEGAKNPEERRGSGGMWDQNGDGEVDLCDILESDVAGEAAEDKMMAGMTDVTSAQGKPWFMITQCTVAFGLWAVNAYRKSTEDNSEALSLKAGLDTFQPGMFDLKLFDEDCNDLRGEAWRFLTYQFTHIGVMHVTMNCFLNIMLGIPLEGMHGGFRMFIMFNIGVLGGACCYFVNNPFDTVVGMSGGCYSLIGMHFADLIMNWHQKKFRKPTLLFICILAGADITSYMLTMSAENASHSAHMGGAIAGLIIGVMIGENMEVKTYERVLQAICTLIGFGLVGFTMAWNYTNWPPTDLWGSTGYCWYRQVWMERQGWDDRWMCARCGGLECVNHFTQDRTPDPSYEIRMVSYGVCKTMGWDYDVASWQSSPP